MKSRAPVDLALPHLERPYFFRVSSDSFGFREGAGRHEALRGKPTIFDLHGDYGRVR